MAAPTRIIALNLGTQTITLAEFQPNPAGGVILTRYKKSEILGDPAADATRVAQTKLQLQQLVEEFGIKGQKAYISIASHVIFTRPVHLPTVGEASQVEQIVGFEAAQNVPYPIDQVVWDWQLLDGGEDGEMEVILAAIKADLLDEISDAVQSAGLVTHTVDIAPMALYNSVRYNYADADGCTLLVDIGSRTTNLLFSEPGKIFPRRLNLGGSTISTAIAKDFGVSFSEADARKAEDGFVSLGGSYAEPDDMEIARISKVIRNQMTKLHQEIARSITFYRSEHSGSAPARVLLAGGTASLPYMREFFQEKFPGVEVEYFNPLQNVAVTNTLSLDDVGRDAHTLGEVTGLALRGVGNCPMELNLRPASVVRAAKIAAQRPYLIAAGVLAMATVAAWWQYFDRAAMLTLEQSDGLQGNIRALQPFDNAITAARSKIRKVEEDSAPLIKATADREYWLRVIDDLNARLPAKFIWITSFEPPTKEELAALTPPETPVKKPGGKKPKEEPEVKIPIHIKGLYLATEAENSAGSQVVFDFINNLKDSPMVSPPSDQDASKISVRVPDGTTWAYDFDFPLYLKQNPFKIK